MKVCLFGYNGKVGSKMLAKLKETDCDLVLIEKNTKIDISNLKNCDYAIDFSVPEESYANARLCNSLNIPLLICSTGQNEKQIKKIEKLTLNVPIVLCQNTSAGMGYIKAFINKLPNEDILGAHISEVHNKNKKDCPSGTAMMLAKLLESKNINTTISSERACHDVSVHTVKLYLKNEVVCLTHYALSSEVFCDGALKIAQNLKNMPAKFFNNNSGANYYEEA